MIISNTVLTSIFASSGMGHSEVPEMAFKNYLHNTFT